MLKPNKFLQKKAVEVRVWQGHRKNFNSLKKMENYLNISFPPYSTLFLYSSKLSVAIPPLVCNFKCFDFYLAPPVLHIIFLSYFFPYKFFPSFPHSILLCFLFTNPLLAKLYQNIYVCGYIYVCMFINNNTL